MRAGVHGAVVVTVCRRALGLGRWPVIDVGWSVKAEGELYMRFASKRCSARTPARDVKSAPWSASMCATA